MLTEIEWWGGLLFIWLAFAYYMMAKEYLEQGDFDVRDVLLHASYLLVAVLLTAYFYVLKTPLMQQSYVGVFVVGGLISLAWSFWPESDSDDDTAEDEEDRLVGIVSFVLVPLPLLIVYALAAWKSYAYLDQLPFLA